MKEKKGEEEGGDVRWLSQDKEEQREEHFLVTR